MTARFAMSSTSALRSACVTLLACGLSGCAMIHDAGKPAARIAPEQIALARDLHLARDGWPEARWWTAFGDHQLDALVDYALARAPDALVARARVEQARGGVDAARAASMPAVHGLGAVDRQRVSANSFLGPFGHTEPALGLTGPWYTEGLVGVTAAYNVDLWGEERSRIDAAIGVENARLAEAAAVELEIASTVAQLYYAFQGIEERTTLLRQALAVQADSVASHRAWARRGLESVTPSAEAEATRLLIEQQITANETAAKQVRETLRTFIGAHADDMPPMEPAPLPQTHLGVPDELSYQLLARRPDLQAMRWYVQASLDQVEAAKAMFYPRLDIKAFFGLDSIHIEDLFSVHSAVVHLMPGLSLPIFDGGRLNANLRGTRAVSNTVIEQYNGAVLRAVRDVAVAGTELQAMEQQERLQEARVKEAEVVLASAEASRGRGLISATRALEARLPVLYQRAALIDLRARHIGQHVALVKALGGGYHAEEPPERVAQGTGQRDGAPPGAPASRSSSP